MDLNKYIVNPDDGKPFHSSAYAKVAYAGHVGSVGTTSFSQRRQIEGSRQVVGAYTRSLVRQVPREMRAHVVVPQRGVVDSPPKARSEMSQRAAPLRTTFIEPSGRLHNPFA